jgi:hypothetical protein
MNTKHSESFSAFWNKMPARETLKQLSGVYRKLTGVFHTRTGSLVTGARFRGERTSFHLVPECLNESRTTRVNIPPQLKEGKRAPTLDAHITGRTILLVLSGYCVSRELHSLSVGNFWCHLWYLE